MSLLERGDDFQVGFRIYEIVKDETFANKCSTMSYVS